MKLIKKQYLAEVRSVANPPPLIKMALESACILRGESSPIDWKGTRDDPFRQELRALEEAAVIKKSEASRMHGQNSILEAAINHYEEEEKAKRLRKLKAEEWSSWRSFQTMDVHREAAGKNPQIGDVLRKAAVKAWAPWGEYPEHLFTKETGRQEHEFWGGGHQVLPTRRQAPEQQ